MEFKAFAVSSNKAASVDSTLKIFSVACIAVSDPASCPAHASSDPAYETTSFLSTDTMNFPVILRRISPTPIGRKPGFFLRWISLSATNSSMERMDISSVQIVLKKFLIFLRSAFVSLKSFEHRILLYLSASIVERPDTLFVSMAVFPIIFSSIPASTIGWTLCAAPVSKTSLLTLKLF